MVDLTAWSTQNKLQSFLKIFYWVGGGYSISPGPYAHRYPPPPPCKSPVWNPESIKYIYLLSPLHIGPYYFDLSNTQYALDKINLWRNELGSSQSLYLGCPNHLYFVVPVEGSTDSCALGENEGERCPDKHPDNSESCMKPWVNQIHIFAKPFAHWSLLFWPKQYSIRVG